VAVHTVTVGAETMERGPVVRALDRLAATFILFLLGLGSLFLWIGIPFVLLWFFGRVTDSWNAHYVMGVLLIPVGMALFAPFLFWLNGLYLRVTGVLDRDDDDSGRRLRGPLEPLLYAGLLIAVVAFIVWFFFYASNPSGTFW
jgi:hypothetical protein